LLTWLTRIVVNQAVGQLRMKRNEPTIETASSWDSPDGVVCISQVLDPEQQVLRIERHRKLHTALQKIRPNYRTVIQLRQFEEMSIAETAQQLGITTARYTCSTSR
jgi:RNA polymerase sigma-70 factor, ECF subfamily